MASGVDKAVNLGFTHPLRHGPETSNAILSPVSLSPAPLSTNLDLGPDSKLRIRCSRDIEFPDQVQYLGTSGH